MKNYRADPEGLLELAADLAVNDPKVQAQAVQALIQEPRLRDAVSLVRVSLQIADDAILAGRFDGNRAQLETLRPIEAMLLRLRDLTTSPDRKVRDAAASAIQALERKAQLDHGAV